MTISKQNEERNSRKQKILAAGEKLFTRYSYDNVTLKDLSREAGVNSALVSYYFGGKRGLYCGVLQDKFTKFLNTLDASSFAGLSPIESLRKFLHGQIRLQIDNPDGYKMLYREMMDPSEAGEPMMRENMKAILERIVPIVAAGQENGTIRKKPDAKSITFTMLGNLGFFLLTRKFLDLLEEDQYNEYEFIQKISDEYLQSLFIGKEISEPS